MTKKIRKRNQPNTTTEEIDDSIPLDSDIDLDFTEDFLDLEEDYPNFDSDNDDDEDDEDDSDFYSDDDDEDDTDFDSHDDDVDDDDTDFDSDDVDDDDDDINDTSLFSDVDDSNEDLFTMFFEKRVAQLPTKKWLEGIVSDVTVEKVIESQFGKPWIKVKVHFELTNPTTGDKVTIVETGAKPKQASGRMYNQLVAINGGKEPTHLKKLIKKKVKVQIEHHTDDRGNVWDNVAIIKAL